MNTFTIFFLALFLSFYGNSQTQNFFNHWYFGNGVSIDFNSGSPIVTNNGSLHTDEGCATISDDQGNLLFYTDGDTIWNRNHIAMLNGTNLTGDPSATQSALIVPKPDNAMQYYVFTLDEHLSAGDLHYSIVDMSLDGGDGDVILISKNTFLNTNFTEKLVAAKGNCSV